jgi:hypothetical protein
MSELAKALESLDRVLGLRAARAVTCNMGCRHANDAHLRTIETFAVIASSNTICLARQIAIEFRLSDLSVS